MPRTSHPIDKVLEYFQTAPLEAAEQAAHVIKGMLKERHARAGVSAETAAPIPVKKPRRRTVRTPKPPSLTAAQAGAE